MAGREGVTRLDALVEDCTSRFQEDSSSGNLRAQVELLLAGAGGDSSSSLLVDALARRLGRVGGSLEEDILLLATLACLEGEAVEALQAPPVGPWLAKLARALARPDATPVLILWGCEVLNALAAAHHPLGPEDAALLADAVPPLLRHLDEGPASAPLLAALATICTGHAPTPIRDPDTHPLLRPLRTMAYNAVGQTLIARFNAPSAPEDQQHAAALLALLLEHIPTFLYPNDLRVLVDVVLREVQRLGEEDLSILRQHMGLLSLASRALGGLSAFQRAELQAFVTRVTLERGEPLEDASSPVREAAWMLRE